MHTSANPVERTLVTSRREYCSIFTIDLVTDRYRCTVRWQWQSAQNFRRTRRSNSASVSDFLHRPARFWSVVLVVQRRWVERLTYGCRNCSVLYKRKVRRLHAAQRRSSVAIPSPLPVSLLLPFLPLAQSRKPSACVYKHSITETLLYCDISDHTRLTHCCIFQHHLGLQCVATYFLLDVISLSENYNVFFCSIHSAFVPFVVLNFFKPLCI